MGAWEDFFDDWRVYCLLESVTVSEPSDSSPGERASSPLADGQPLRTDHVTGHLGRELLDAVRVEAVALGIAIHAAYADVTLLPIPQASAEVPGDQPWIRYKLTVDARATNDQLVHLHRRVQSACVRRLENEYEAPIAGSLINTHREESTEQ